MRKVISPEDIRPSLLEQIVLVIRNQDAPDNDEGSSISAAVIEIGSVHIDLNLKHSAGKPRFARQAPTLTNIAGSRRLCPFELQINAGFSQGHCLFCKQQATAIAACPLCP